jgi:hypothetical protein
MGPAEEKSARDAIARIAAGADPGAEAFALSNAFTDRQTARLRAWLRRVFRR